MEKVYQARPYQAEAISTVFTELGRGIDRQLIVMATGLGKTYVAVNIAHEFEHVLMIAHREELIDQAFDAFEQFYPLQVGIIKEKRMEIDKKIVVASVQTLTNRLDKIDPGMFNLVIVDEMHHYMAETYVKVARHFTPQLFLGLTATPHRFDGLNLSNLVEKIVFDFGIDKGVHEGWLCKLDAYRISTGVDISNIKRTGGDYNKKELTIVVDSPERNRLIVSKYREYAEGRQTIVFAVDITHARNITNAFREQGYNAEFVVSDEDLSPDRKRLIDNFKAGRIQIMVNVMILTEGFDHPDAGCIIMARPTQSLTVYIQCIGRGTRLKSQNFVERFGKNECIILDFVDNSGKHKLINTWTLEDGKRIEDRIFISDERKEVLIEKREAMIREKRVTLKAGGDKKINLLKLPKVEVRKNPDGTFFGGFLEPASEKQITWMRSKGVWEPGVEYTKGMASEFITNFEAEDWMLKQLRGWGYDCSNIPTVGQYYEVKRDREMNSPNAPLPEPHLPFQIT